MGLSLGETITAIQGLTGIAIEEIVQRSDGVVLWAAYTDGEEVFRYTGGVQEFVVPQTGVYQLKVWGAQGGGYSGENDGGKGGYSEGTITLQKGDVLYVVVGGTGKDHTGTTNAVVNGGYNGGGDGYDTTDTSGIWYHGAGGGGATHIAKTTGVLSTLVNNKTAVLIVAGGGGGSAKKTGWDNDGAPVDVYLEGGTGGGTSGGGTNGGTQDVGGTGYYANSGSFGEGGSHVGNSAGTSGGGGGWYGGGGHITTGAGGGSGYIGGVEEGETINGQRVGNGKAVIAFLRQVVATPYTWVSSYVGSGDKLEIIVDSVVNIDDYYPTSTKLTTFKVQPDRLVTANPMNIVWHTNTVSTKYCKWIEIEFEEFFSSRSNDANKPDYIQVRKADGTVIGTIYPPKNGDRWAIDVSSASNVYLYCNMGTEGYNATPRCNIKSIIFRN